MLSGIPGAFPIATAMPLSFEAQPDQQPPADFVGALVAALEDLDKSKKESDKVNDDAYTLGKEADINKAIGADEKHGQKQKLFSSELRIHQNLLQNLFNAQI